MTDFYDPVAYDASVLVPQGDVDFYVDLAREAGRADLPVLELACGTGRVSIPIARQGICVVGLDQSPAMLGRAREKSAGMSTVRWVEGDMRNFDLPQRFGLAIIPFRSFQHLLTVADQLSCLACIHRHLVPGGRFALHLFNPDVVRIAGWLTTRRGTLQQIGDGYTHPSGRQAKRWELPSYRTAEQLLDVMVLNEQLDDAGAVISRAYRDLKLRYTFRYEMEHLFARTGFEIEALYGDFSYAPFNDASVEQVWIARRPLEG
jgi:SAM-dependent methyltransferase